MKNFFRILLIVAACFAGGYGIGTLIGSNMKDKGETGYIGKQTPEIVNGVMSAEAMLSMGRVSDPQISPDSSLILYGVSYTDISENRSCRNLFVCNADGSNPRQISKFAKSVSCARWSSDGKTIFFLQGGQLWKAPFSGKKLGRKVCLSEIPAGMGEFKISPDGSKIMYTSTVKNPLMDQPKDVCADLSKARAYSTENLMYRHWDHWVLEIPRTYVSSFNVDKITSETSRDILCAEGEETFELPTEPFGGIEQLDWAPDSRHIAYSCRKKSGKEYAFSTNTDIFIYDTESGECVPVTNGGGYDTNPIWSPDGSALAWISMERDGYEADRQRLMVAEVNNDFSIAKVSEVTVGFPYDVEGFIWTGCGRKILFNSTIDGLCAICRVSAREGAAPVERLTPDSWWLGFGAPFHMSREDDGITMLTTVYSMDFPTELARVNVGDDRNAEWRQLTFENGHILNKLDTVRTESIVLKTYRGENLQCWVLYPPKFDASKTYPIIEVFNGGPQSTMDQSWSYRWNFRLMASQGYVVVLPNRHGNAGFGQPWKEEISGDYQGLNMQDYIIAGKWAKKQPWAGKMAGVGASYGGFSVYNMMGIHNGLFDCFISHAGIFSERQMWYTTEEMWFANWDAGGLREYAYEPGKVGPSWDGVTFGGMQQAGAPYSWIGKSRYHYANEPETRVTTWKTPLLCMHGMMDYRIPYEQGMAAFNAAQMMGVPSKLVIFPEENHWILQPQNALFWQRTFFDWLDRWIK